MVSQDSMPKMRKRNKSFYFWKKIKRIFRKMLIFALNKVFRVNQNSRTLLKSISVRNNSKEKISLDLKNSYSRPKGQLKVKMIRLVIFVHPLSPINHVEAYRIFNESIHRNYKHHLPSPKISISNLPHH